MGGGITNAHEPSIFPKGCKFRIFCLEGLRAGWALGHQGFMAESA